MPNQATATMRSCRHADVGDCEVTCWGIGPYVVGCSNCGNEFDLNHEGRHEENIMTARTFHFACPDCPLPSESAALPRLNPSLVAVISLEEGL